mmetsp:Transcript_36584/g.68128  ORF Transcript_36584/g.68128 Transcript_36584/m.68128 type:complete len:426 (-) Transcript_36584:197-1474(-)
MQKSERGAPDASSIFVGKRFCCHRRAARPEQFTTFANLLLQFGTPVAGWQLLGQGRSLLVSNPFHDEVTTCGILKPVESLFLRYGNFANAFSVAFDPDFERHLHPEGSGSSDKAGVIAYARFAPLAVTGVFFDPLCSEEVLPSVLDEFLKLIRLRSPGERMCFWKVSRPVAKLLAKRGYFIAPYGVENDVLMPRSLRGRRLENLRSEIKKARRKGIVVELVPWDAPPETWAELEQVNARWLASKPQLTARFLQTACRRVTRHLPYRHERHCTRIVARRPDGSAVGWAALDHLYQEDALIGFAPNLRFDPAAGYGVAALLAIEGASILQQQIQQSDVKIRLALGESPLVEFPEEQGIFFGKDERRARVLERIFSFVRERGSWLYGVRGISNWKRKWKADNKPETFVAVDSEFPLRTVVSMVALLLR